jgi:peptidoglycan/LPS O-acetylase OafA/YrhL
MLIFHVGWDYTYNAFDTRADALLIGCWLAATLQGSGPSTLPRWALKSRWLVLLPILALIFCSQVDLSKTVDLGMRLTAFTLEPVFSGLLLLQLMLWGTVGWKFLEHWMVKLLARLSYSIYLFHLLVFGLRRFIPIHHAQRAAMIPLVLAVSAASYYLVERPIMKIRDRGREKSVLLDDGLHPTPENRHETTVEGPPRPGAKRRDARQAID